MCEYKGKRVFLSGPMTGMPDWNREAFTMADGMALTEGATHVFNPAADAPHGDDPHSHEHWMMRTLHELTRNVNGTRSEDREPYYDVLALLPGWEQSEGAKVERTVAEACGIEVVEL